MTKEEFDAEVYEYAKSRNGTEDSRMTDRMLAYRAGAEPREKRIADLEAQIEKMKRYLDCEYCAHYTQSYGCKNCNEELRSDWSLRR